MTDLTDDERLVLLAALRQYASRIAVYRTENGQIARGLIERLDPCPTVTDKDPCPCVKRATRDALGEPEPQEEP